ncbi:hypothetical protein AWB74_06010 [Caballeronia arvi]|uniref:Uncharacterized protein n=1 Tax=Caballeronia arvi TaxID=1777135 RepID=A0A158KKF5_9BURK|nr:hypothetical protein [Caballeronia arvi]SAL81648.1 hypothetical protein AWB74_06010 [Caballeronia arvi]
MDLREIQRLHAQFAPDSMTIDLPRQIAALPAPAVFESDSKSSKLTSRMSKSGPVLRRCAKPLLIALIVAMAGVGAARIWHAVGASTMPQKSSGEKASSQKNENATAPVLASEPALRPIDASPARPVAVAPMLSASDLGNAPTVGLTVDQFRNSLSPTSATNTGNAGAAKATPTASNETKLAAVSPIRQSHREPQAARAVAAPQPQIVQAESKPVVPVVPVVLPAPPAPATTSSASAAVAPVPAQAAERGTSSPPATRAHSYRHHTVRPRDEQASDSDTAPAASNKKPAPASRAGSNEVQMF